VSDYLADTSVFVAIEHGRELGDPPEGRARISVATLTELLVGVHRADDAPTREWRERTLARANAFVPLAFDEHVAVRLAELLAAARAAGRRAPVMDAIVAATALAHDLTVWTQDDDYDVLAELAPDLRVVRG
jgi:predicted nucleic acid-binding protein